MDVWLGSKCASENKYLNTSLTLFPRQTIRLNDIKKSDKNEFKMKEEIHFFTKKGQNFDEA